MNPTVGVVGASARAAVHSLARAGLSAWAVDLFADRDLALVATCARCPPDRYPAALPELARQFPPGPVLYTGGLENHPRVVAELATDRELWGNPPEVLERVRDPQRVFPASDPPPIVPVVVPRRLPCPAAGRWLRKPLRSAAGHGVRFATPGEAPSEAHYFQEFIAGMPMSAAFRDHALIDATEQLVGEPWLHARPFAYCGNIGPVRLAEQADGALVVFGLELAEEYGLRGVWGIDFVRRDDLPCLIEVNPRYTASIEVLEHGSGRAVFADSVAATRSGARGVVGKAIYYAPHRVTFPEAGPWDADISTPFDPWRLPAFADIPAPGSVIEADHPVLTVFASGSSPAECRERLQSRAAELDRLFAEGGQ
ncbi:MAG TPA: ATP-grasp domain-containing protein [Gemmataceae bacterium]|nr:ATP-grasp domain-containing protein [Gemmataceae bacterium]